jgi:hypothetical protein
MQFKESAFGVGAFAAGPGVTVPARLVGTAGKKWHTGKLI